MNSNLGEIKRSIFFRYHMRIVNLLKKYKNIKIEIYPWHDLFLVNYK